MYRRPPATRQGFTLIELLIAVTIMGVLSAGIVGLLQTSIQMQTEDDIDTKLYEEGFRAMDRMTGKLRKCTFLLVPIAQAPTRDLLAFSGTINDDDDYYFGDTMFPRIDEDATSDMNLDGACGIKGIDEDNDGWQTAAVEDDDEDGFVNEDKYDGIDNDGDGNIDEDCWGDMNDDMWPGIKGMDDDGDKSVDEADYWDDDEDGKSPEDPLNALVYFFDSDTNTLVEQLQPDGVATIICKRVTDFKVTYYQPSATLGPLVYITLGLTAAGETVTPTEAVYPESIGQRNGTRVR